METECLRHWLQRLGSVAVLKELIVWLRSLFRAHRILRQTAAQAARCPHTAALTRQPAWVPGEIVRLKAQYPHERRRKIANAFNRNFTTATQVAAGETYVHTALRRHAYELELLRRLLCG